MAAMLMVPSQTVWAAPLPEGQVNAGTSAETSESSPVKKATASSADKEVHTSGKKTAATVSSASRQPKEEIRFNTGNAEVSVVSQEDFFEHDLGDVYFEEDGSYTASTVSPDLMVSVPLASCPSAPSFAFRRIFARLDSSP